MPVYAALAGCSASCAARHRRGVGSLADNINSSLVLHSHSLGTLCIVWAALDQSLIELLGEMVPTTSEAAHILSSEIVTQRCEALKKLSYTRSIPREWSEDFCLVMDKLIELSARRNRFVRDYWTVDSAPLKRIDQRARLQSLGAHLGKELVYSTSHEHLPDEVDQLAARVGLANIVIHAARIDMQSYNEKAHFPARTMLSQIKALLTVPANTPQTQTKAPQSPPPASAG